MKPRLVIVGSGMASGRMLEHLCADPRANYQITLFGAEPHGNYNRIMLSPVLAGEQTFDEIVTHNATWYAQRSISCRFGETVTAIDRERKTVVSLGGETPYDKLVIATGSVPFVPPIAGKDLKGVVTFRSLDDVETMLATAKKPGAKAVVVGGGLLGLEAAAALRKRGMEVTVLHLMEHLMELQLDPAAATMLRTELEGRGIGIRCGAQTKAILGHEGVEAVLLDDGSIYPADMVVVAAGIRPETRIATDARLHVERGIVVDDRIRTSDPDILALGECAEHAGRCFGFVEPLYEMAQVAARTLVNEEAFFRPAKMATNLKVTGVHVFSAGDLASTESCDQILLLDASAGLYKKILLRNGKVTGVVLFGDTADGPWYLDLIRTEAPVSAFRSGLAFGPAVALKKAA